MRHTPLLVLAVAALMAGNAHVSSAPGDSDAYRAGTDIGALYLSEYLARLRVALLLRECGETELSQIVSAGLPNSVEYAHDKLSASDLSEADILAASQITRAYLLGYEVGVRAEYRGEKSEARKTGLCSASKENALRDFSTGQ